MNVNNGPGRYTPNIINNKHKSPSYSISTKTEVKLNIDTPGPGQYNYEFNNFEKNSNPKFKHIL